MANVHGLFSGKKDDNKDDDEEESNNRYVGGVDSRGGGSGLAVEPNHEDAPSARDSVFRQAENVGPDGNNEEIRRTITMYRDGFVVDDGPYRRLDDPSNADFLRSLAQGMTPRELLGEAGSADVTVGLIDKRNEEYVEQFQSFSGTGASLGTTTKVEGDSVDPAALPETPPAPDASQPTTSIQVRLANGQGRRVIRLNLSQSVLDLAAHLRDAAPNNAPFRLLAGFPPKPLTNWNQSVEEAGLKGASVSMQSAD